MTQHNDQIVRLYDTIFDRAPDTEGLAFWNGATDRGLSMGDMADLFITAPEFAQTYGQPDNGAFVREMYANVLDRPGEAGGVEFWTRVLDTGLADRGHIAFEFSESPEHIAQMTAPPLGLPPGQSAPNPSPFPEEATIPESQLPPPALGLPPGQTAPNPSPIPPEAQIPESQLPPVSSPPPSRIMQGTGGNDVMNGGAGDDIIAGLGGQDVMTGGAGYNVFTFPLAAAQMNGDTIHRFDMDGNDVIDIHGLQDGAFTFARPGAPMEFLGEMGVAWGREFVGGGTPSFGYVTNRHQPTPEPDNWVVFDLNGDAQTDVTLNVSGQLGADDFLL